MHILITANTAWNLLNFRRALLSALVADGHQVTALVPLDDQVPALEALGCRILPLKMDRKGLSPLSNGMLALRFWDIFRREAPDIVLSFTIKNNIFGAFAARLTGIPFVPNVTGLGTAFLTGSTLQMLVERLYKAAFHKSPTVFFQNKDDCQLFLEHGLVRADQAQVLPGSGIDLQHFPVTPFRQAVAKTTRFLMISRLLRDKGVVEYAEAARQIRTDHPEAEFALLGPLDHDNHSAIAQATLQGWIDDGRLTHLGETTDVRPYIADTDCIVLPSYREGTPRTLMEAAAMGRPVITTDVPGCRDVVEDTTTGFLCPARNADALAAVFTRFLQLDRKDQYAMGMAGRKKMEQNYDQERVIAAYRQALTSS